MPSISARDPMSDPALVDLPAVAVRLGVNERHIRRLVAERRIPFVKWGHLLRFDPSEIDAWLDQSRIPVSRR
jgi:excisionase family DNA binding protein